MRVEIDIAKIRHNISKAKSLTNSSISLMFKDFYEDIYRHLGDVDCRIFSKNIDGSICYSLFNAQARHQGCFVTTYGDFVSNYTINGIREFYIPVNANDNREGLSVEEAKTLCREIKSYDSSTTLYGALTSGCLDEKHPTREEMQNIWQSLSEYINSLSVGGSFWLAKGDMPNYVRDIRIGEYMLFGTIPYDNNEGRLGENAIKIKSRVIGVYPERNQLIIDCGYSLADVKNCTLNKKGLRFVNTSSEYSIFEIQDCDIKIGDEIELIPDYKSLVKLKDAQRNYI